VVDEFTKVLLCLTSEMSTGMSSLLHGNPNCSILRNNGATSFVGFSALPFMQLRAGAFMKGLLAGPFFLIILNFVLFLYYSYVMKAI
jgi:hypothetical protein